MLPKHPIIATATAVAIATARHSLPPQPRSLHGFIVVVVVAVIVVVAVDVVAVIVVVVVIVTAITTIFPPLVFVLSSCPLPFLIWWWPSRPPHPPSSLLSLSSSWPSLSLPSLSSSSLPTPPPPPHDLFDCCVHVISTLHCLLIVDSNHCGQWCRRCHRGHCVGSSLAATAAEDDRIEVDNGVESLLSSAPPPPPWQQIGGQRHAAKAP